MSSVFKDVSIRNGYTVFVIISESSIFIFDKRVFSSFSSLIFLSFFFILSLFFLSFTPFSFPLFLFFFLPILSLLFFLVLLWVWFKRGIQRKIKWVFGSLCLQDYRYKRCSDLRKRTKYLVPRGERSNLMKRSHHLLLWSLENPN